MGGLAHPMEKGMLGVRVVEPADLSENIPLPHLAYDELYISYSQQAIVVGELAHFLWRQFIIAGNNEVRQAAREHIRATAERILGEPWKLADEQ
jgi:hypothetical protein